MLEKQEGSLTVDELAGIGPQDVHADDHSCALLEDQLEEALRCEHAAAQARRVRRLACHEPTAKRVRQQQDENHTRSISSTSPPDNHPCPGAEKARRMSV